MVLNPVDIDGTENVNECLRVDVHDIDIDVLDGVRAGLFPLKKMMLRKDEVDDAEDNVSPLGAMRIADSILRWTRMYDAQCFRLMQCQGDGIGVVVDKEVDDTEVLDEDDAEDGHVDVVGPDVETHLLDHDVLHIDDVLF